MTAEVDHRLARRALVRRVRSGEVSRSSVCDAHPELLRVARRFGRRTLVTCPICAEGHLVTVSYVFGPRLPRHGRLVGTRAELESFDARPEAFVAYLVEVCPACSWHHLLTQRPLGGRRRSAIAGSSVH